MSQIHWKAPVTLVSFLAAGVGFALGHHFFYASLDHKDATTSSEDHSVLGMHVTSQQFNVAVGTAFAFLVRSALMISIFASYFQILIWTVKKRTSRDTKVGDLDNMTSVLRDLISFLSFKTWWRYPWLWLLALVTWLLPIATIIAPAALSVGISNPPNQMVIVPQVDFKSLNLVAPMSVNGRFFDNEVGFAVGGPSFVVQSVTGAVVSQGSILSVMPPAPNSTWDLNFFGPSLNCNPVNTTYRQSILDNILNYTSTQPAQIVSVEGSPDMDCSIGPGFLAWHPYAMQPDSSIEELLPFPNGRGNLNDEKSFNVAIPSTASVFLVVTPVLIGYRGAETANDSMEQKYMCRKTPGYQSVLGPYYDTSTVLRCDLRNSSYDTSFSFVDGIQDVEIKRVEDVDAAPMTTLSVVSAVFESVNSSDSQQTPRPIGCPPGGAACLADPQILSTMSYQAIMVAFMNLVTSMISKDQGSMNSAVFNSTTQLAATVLADSPEFAFLQYFSQEESANSAWSSSAQQMAADWTQQPFSGLVNTSAATRPKMPFKDALEGLFRKNVISLMSAPELQPNPASAYYPNETRVQISTLVNIYVYAQDKLWLAYGLAIATTTALALCGLVAIMANNASFSDKFSTNFRLSRGAHLSCELETTDLLGQDPLPEHIQDARVAFSSARIGKSTDVDMLMSEESGVYRREQRHFASHSTR